jgi:hypothetical protein
MIGMRFMGKSFPDYKNEYWFGIIMLIVGIISGIIPVAIFIGSCVCIGEYLQKNKSE